MFASHVRNAFGTPMSATLRERSSASRGTLAVALTLLAALSIFAPQAIADEPAPAVTDSKLATAAVKVLKTYCQRCHGIDFKVPGFDVMDRATLIRPKDAKADPFLVPGKLEDSRLWTAISAGLMPPERQPQPTDEEKEILSKWIASGASYPAATRPKREFLGEDTLLKIVLDDLREQPAARRRFARYFSLVHLWNDPNISDDQLRIYRAAISKLVNSLSNQFRITLPRAIDPEGLVLAIDLRDYGWHERQQWNTLLSRYPYGLKRGTEIAEQVYDMSACDLPYVRADWFIYRASKPPLYHDLLAIPMNAADLERQLGVDVRDDFDRDRAWRAGFSKSGVSQNNRIVERHDAKHGAYWKSYDFKSSVEQGNIFQFPLGPPVKGRDERATFKHDGGEIIWNLPNGLQAYMLAKANDDRIDEGPVNIVSDANHFAGTPAVVNGISCMGCHKHGMIKFTDAVRPTFNKASGQPVADKVQRLFPPAEEMNRMVDTDAERFLAAVEKCVGPFLRTGPDDRRKTTELIEPITAAYRIYDRSLNVNDVARELGLPEDDASARKLEVPAAREMATVIRLSDSMRRLGLAPLINGEPVHRELWEQAYQRCARELKLGVPIDF